MWTDLIPKLMKWLKKNQEEEGFKEAAWEELVLRFLSLSLDEGLTHAIAHRAWR